MNEYVITLTVYHSTSLLWSSEDVFDLLQANSPRKTPEPAMDGFQAAARHEEQRNSDPGGRTSRCL